MAATYDAVSSVAKPTAVTDWSFTHVCTGSDLVLTMLIFIEDGAGINTGTPTYNGVSMTRKTDHSDATHRLESWYLINPSTGSNTLAITLSGGRKGVAAAVSVTGADQVNGITQSVGGINTSGTSATRTLTGIDTNSLAIDLLGFTQGTSYLFVEGADQTQRWSQNENDSDQSGKGTGSTQLGSAGGVMSWTWTNSGPTGQVTVEVAEVAAAITFTPKVMMF